MSKYLSLFFVALLFFSCNNDDESMAVVDSVDPGFVADAKAWVPSSLGSYWIYQAYKIDSFGDYNPIGEPDSVYNEANVFINGEVYTNQKGMPFTTDEGTFFRDSMGYMVNQFGRKIFVDAQESELLSDNTVDGLYTTTITMIGDTSIVFNSQEESVKHSRIELFKTDGTLFCETEAGNYWLKDVGLLRKDMYFTSDCESIRIQLLRYHIEE